MKNISLALFILICLVAGLQDRSYSDSLSERQRVYLEKHVEKMRTEKPREYQQMVDKAGGTIVNCLSCHEEEFRKKEEPSR